MSRHVALRLLDPEGLIDLIRQIRTKPRYSKRFYIGIGLEGRFQQVPRQYAFGSIIYREKSKTYAIRGEGMFDFEDEIREVFENEGLKVVFVQPKGESK